MVRPLERIPRTLKEIEEIWLKYPNLRLGQLIGNLKLTDTGLYYLKDDLLIEKLKELYIPKKEKK